MADNTGGGPRRGRIAVRIVVAWLALCLTTVGITTPAQADQDPVRLRIAGTQVPDSLNPFLAAFISSNELFRMNYDVLVMSDAKDYSPTPGLAEKWESNDDGTEWTFTIRKGEWSDGEPITAEDVAWTFNTIMSNPAAQDANGDAFEEYKSVEAKDDRTLVITTKVPLPENLILGNGTPIVPKHIWDGKKDPGKDPNDEFPMVGSGPYIVSEYVTDQFIRLKKNPKYWGPEPKVDEVVYTIFKDSDAAVQALLKGDVDLVPDMTAAQFKTVENAPDISARAGVSRRFSELTFNPGAKKDGKAIGDGHPALRDPKVRQALHHAIDINAIVDKVLDGYAEPGAGYIPPAFANWAWKPDAATAVTFDLAKANEMLDAAGYKRGKGGIRTMPDGSKPLEFRLLGHSESASEAPLSEYVKEWFGELGIKVTPSLVSNGSLNDQTSAGKFDMAFSGWSANADPNFILSIQTCNAPTTDTFYCNEEYDKLFKQQAGEMDEAKRKEIVGQMQKNLYENAPVITLFYAQALEAQRTDTFEPFVRQPQPDGVSAKQQGRWAYEAATPAGAKGGAGRSGSGDGEDGGIPIGLWIGIGIAIVIAAGGGAAFTRRKKAQAGDKE